MDLFSQSHANASAPLAYRMRPRRLEEYIGQQALVAGNLQLGGFDDLPDLPRGLGNQGRGGGAA